MKPRDVENYLASHRKTTIVVLAIFLVTAVSGYFMGMRQTRSFADDTKSERDRLLHERPASVPMGDVPLAVAYGELHEAKLQPNANWENYLHALPTVDPDAKVDASPQTDEQRIMAVSTRNARRAYSGAPPVVPHPIAQRATSSCIACHGAGTDGLLKGKAPHPTEHMHENSCQTCHGGRAQPLIAGKAPPLISHGLYANCTQCHIPAGGHGEGATVAGFGMTAANSFAGRPEPGAGTRAYDGAPPTIPHPTRMREKCASCHGPGRANAIRTSHPERQSCNQCHAPSAEFDQRHFDLTAVKSPVSHPVKLNAPPPILDRRQLQPAPRPTLIPTVPVPTPTPTPAPAPAPAPADPSPPVPPTAPAAE